jgi:hypothetical protein
LFNNLDYSFTVDHEKGNFEVPEKQPGGGGRRFRSQLYILRQVLDEIDFISMKPANSILQDSLRNSATVRILAGKGQYLIYLNNTIRKVPANADSLVGPKSEVLSLNLEIPAGPYSVTWINTITGERSTQAIEADLTGKVILETPPFSEDIALLIRKK